MAITPLITKTESDTYNALSSAWLALTDVLKDNHIYNASLYMQAQFTCEVDDVAVDWADPTTLDDDMKRACAYYADADRLGVLFDDVATTEPHRAIIEEKKKLGSMEKTLKWASSGSFTSANPLESIDSIMLLYCTSNAGSTKLTRV